MRNLTVTLALIILIPAMALAADGPVGDWDIDVEADGGTNSATLTITEENGKLSGTADSDLGILDLANVAYEGNTLTFTMEIEEAGVSIEFTGTINGDSIEGQFLIPDMGMEIPVSGMRAGAAPAIVGTWDLMVDSQLGNNPRTLVVNKDLSGTYGGGDFDNFDISGLETDGDTVTFEVTLDVQGQELPCTVTLTLDGNKLDGTLDFGQGEAAIVGAKQIAASIIGKWSLMVDSQLGNNARELVVNDDLTGTYGGGDFDLFPISNVKVDGASVTFDVTLDVQGQELPATFNLTLEGNSISGELDYGQGTAEVTGEKD